MNLDESVIRTRRDLRRAVRQFEQSLGDDAGAVRAHLFDAGVRGAPRDPAGCPVARFFRAVISTDGAVRDVSVGLRSIKVERPVPLRPVRVRHSRAVFHFIGAFDSGLYPDLLGPGATPPEPRPAEDDRVAEVRFGLG